MKISNADVSTNNPAQQSQASPAQQDASIVCVTNLTKEREFKVFEIEGEKLRKATELRVVYVGDLGAKRSENSAFKLSVENLLGALKKMLKFPLGHIRIQKFWFLCIANYGVTTTLIDQSKQSLLQIFSILKQLHTRPEVYIDSSFKRIFSQNFNYCNLDVGKISKFYIISDGYVGKYDMRWFRGLKGDFLTHLGILQAPTKYGKEQQVRKEYVDRLLTCHINRTLFPSVMEPRDNAMMVDMILEKFENTMDDDVNTSLEIDTTTLETDIAYQLRVIRDLMVNYNLVVKILLDASTSKGGKYHCMRLNGKSGVPNFWSWVSKDIVHYIISFLKPRDWEVTGRKRKRKLTFKNQTHVKNIMREFKKVSKNQNSVTYTKTRIESLEKEIARLENLRDKELPNARGQLEQNQKSFVTEKKNFVKALKKIKKGKTRKKRVVKKKADGDKDVKSQEKKRARVEISKSTDDVLLALMEPPTLLVAQEPTLFAQEIEPMEIEKE